MMSTVIADLHHAENVAVDASGNLYAADYVVSSGDHNFDTYYIGRILKMTANGSTNTLAEGQGNNQGLLGPRGIAVDASGNLYAADAAANRVWKISPTGNVSTAAEVYTRPGGVAVDSSDNLYFSDPVSGRIARVSPQGELAIVVGDGTPGSYWGDGEPAHGRGAVPAARRGSGCFGKPLHRGHRKQPGPEGFPGRSHH
jgi:sugar lactone lactonase YvrE